MLSAFSKVICNLPKLLVGMLDDNDVTRLEKVTMQYCQSLEGLAFEAFWVLLECACGLPFDVIWQIFILPVQVCGTCIDDKGNPLLPQATCPTTTSPDAEQSTAMGMPSAMFLSCPSGYECDDGNGIYRDLELATFNVWEPTATGLVGGPGPVLPSPSPPAPAAATPSECFPNETIVETSVHGSVPVGRITTGDKILVGETFSGSLVYAPVLGSLHTSGKSSSEEGARPLAAELSDAV